MSRIPPQQSRKDIPVAAAAQAPADRWVRVDGYVQRRGPYQVTRYDRGPDITPRYALWRGDDCMGWFDTTRAAAAEAARLDRVAAARDAQLQEASICPFPPQ